MKMRYAVEKLDYPLGVVAYESGNKLVFKLKYAGELFAKDKIVELLGGVKLILGQLKELDKKVIELVYVSKKDYQKLVYAWNKTDVVYPEDKTIHELFGEQVSKTPSKIALVYEDVELSYKELHERSNQLANYIRAEYLIKPDDLIALCLDRSEHMLISILAVLKAGGVYVPMDPSYPEERISYMLEDTRAKLLLANNSYMKLLNSIIRKHNKVATKVLAVDSVSLNKQLSGQSVVMPKVNMASHNLAYVIYTSGTTGKPKGVMVEHRSVVRLVRNCNYLTINQNDVFVQMSSILFDASTLEIWGSLLNGNKLVVVSNILDLTSNSGSFNNFIHTNKITVMWLTKTLFDSLYLADNNIFNSINILLVGGEALDSGLINKIMTQR